MGNGGRRKHLWQSKMVVLSIFTLKKKMAWPYPLILYDQQLLKNFLRAFTLIKTFFHFSLFFFKEILGLYTWKSASVGFDYVRTRLAWTDVRLDGCPSNQHNYRWNLYETICGRLEKKWPSCSFSDCLSKTRYGWFAIWCCDWSLYFNYGKNLRGIFYLKTTYKYIGKDLRRLCFAKLPMENGSNVNICLRYGTKTY